MELLGKGVKDLVTGLEGIAIAKCIFLNGCIQYSVQPVVDEKGEVPKEVWVDKHQLKVFGRNVDCLSPLVDGLDGGGFRSHPS